MVAPLGAWLSACWRVSYFPSRTPFTVTDATGSSGVSSSSFPSSSPLSSPPFSSSSSSSPGDGDYLAGFVDFQPSIFRVDHCIGGGLAVRKFQTRQQELPGFRYAGSYSLRQRSGSRGNRWFWSRSGCPVPNCHRSGWSDPPLTVTSALWMFKAAPPAAAVWSRVTSASVYAARPGWQTARPDSDCLPAAGRL